VADGGANGVLEWAVAGRPVPGATVSGDRCVVELTESETLLAVIDGLGHGPDAALAADRAVAVLEENPAEPVDVLLVLCHDALARTRGAAVTVASISRASRTMTWLGVGNVEGVLVRPPPSGATSGTSSLEMAMLQGGVVGHQLPTLRPHAVDLQPGDLVVMATDGIDRSFSDVLRPALAPKRLADGILEDRARPTDDALVLVALYRAEES
jgi:phosphoserine phosphatase RsbX